MKVSKRSFDLSLSCTTSNLSEHQIDGVSCCLKSVIQNYLYIHVMI